MSTNRTDSMGIVIAFAAAMILLSLWVMWAANREPTPAQHALTHCATLDAIAVQTPESWVCVSKAVIPAEEP